jgi:hypothetical protein
MNYCMGFETAKLIQLLLGGAAGTAMTFTQFAGAGVGISAIYSYGKRITRLFFRWK